MAGIAVKAERPWHRVLKGRRLPKAEEPRSRAGEAIANGAVGSMSPNREKAQLDGSEM